MNKKNIRIKLLIIGDCNTGKTALVQKIVNNKFNFKQHLPTFGINYKNTIIKKYNSNLFLDFWDISGSMEYMSLFEIYLFESDVIFLCYDVTDIKSLITICDYWLPEVLEKKNKFKKIQLYLIGNKTDLKYDHVTIINKIKEIQNKFKDITIKNLFFSSKKQKIDLSNIIEDYYNINNLPKITNKKQITFLKKIKNFFSNNKSKII